MYLSKFENTHNRIDSVMDGVHAKKIGSNQYY